MKVFVTGASGFIGQSLVEDLIKHGHQVVGLARSEESAALISKLGAEPFKGDLEDLESLKTAAKACDGVAHLGFVHDFENFDRAVAIDRAAVDAMIEALAGTDKALVIASGVSGLATQSPDTLATEDDEEAKDSSPLSKRAATADAVREASKNGVRGIVVRIPTVHDVGDKGFIAIYLAAAKQSGSVVYIGDGSNRWPAIHRQDLATLLRLALEKGKAGAVYHAVGESAIAIKDVAALIGEKLSLPLESKTIPEAAQTLNFIAYLLALDVPTSSEKTRAELGWNPVGISLLDDMAQNYFN